MVATSDLLATLWMILGYLFGAFEGQWLPTASAAAPCWTPWDSSLNLKTRLVEKASKNNSVLGGTVYDLPATGCLWVMCFLVL